MGAVPQWIAESIGRIVTLSEPCEEFPAGKAGLLVSVRSKAPWGCSGVYATVAFNFADLGDEENVPLESLKPWSFAAVAAVK